MGMVNCPTLVTKLATRTMLISERNFALQSVVFYCPLIISFNFMLFINYANDRIIARLQQPYSLERIPLEEEYQVGDPVKHAFNNQTGNIL